MPYPQGGGIRFGEMERDALLAHGTAALLHDRLQKCSDLSPMYVCTTCGDMLAPMAFRTTATVRPAPMTGQIAAQRGFHPAETLVQNGTAGNGTGGRTLHQPVLIFLIG